MPHFIVIGTAYFLIAFGGLMSLLHWGIFVTSWRNKRFVSVVPLVGALPLGCGLALLPEARPFAWLCLIADYGTLAVIIALPRITFELWSTSRLNLLHAFTTNAKERSITIKLFRRQIALIGAEFDPPAPCDDFGARIGSFGLVGTWTPTDSGFSINGYASDRRLFLATENGLFMTAELNYPSEQKYQYDCLDSLVLQEIH